jgi:xanthosine utilization system XapX-like protein
MPRRVIGYVIGALGGVLSAPAVLIVGLFGMLVPAAIVFLGRRTMAVEVLAIGAFGGAGLGLVWIGVTDYFANWAGTQSCSSGVVFLSPRQSISTECGGMPPAPWLICGATLALAALTLALVVERRRIDIHPPKRRLKSLHR